jgi:hypothetical protein
MTIHANTVLGFLEGWGRTAPEVDVGMAVGVLLGRLAERGTPSRLEVAGQEITFSKETLDQVTEAIRALLLRQKKAGTA